MVDIVSRADWGANPSVTPAGNIRLPSQNVWLHHTASTGLHGASGMRSLQHGAIAGGYSDLEYTYVVDTDGTIFESRGPGKNTAAQNAPGGPDNNAVSHAICAMGNFETQQPTEQLIQSIGDLVAWMFHNAWIDRAALDGPHRNAPGCSTACCGANLIAQIGRINQIAAGTAPAPAPPKEDDVPANKDTVAAYANSEGAWRLEYDGGVQTQRGPFYGSYFTLDAKDRNDPARRFLAITGPANGASHGYTLWSVKGEAYTFTTKQ